MIGAAVAGFFVIVAYCAYYLIIGVLGLIAGIFRAITGRPVVRLEGMGGNGGGGGGGNGR
jgi:hypothetical protein